MIHLRIVDQQIIIESNGGQVDVVSSLLELGVPRRSMVFGWFHTSIADELEGGDDADEFEADFFERVQLNSPLAVPALIAASSTLRSRRRGRYTYRRVSSQNASAPIARRSPRQ